MGEVVRRAADAGVRRITVLCGGGGGGPVERAVEESVRTEGVVREPYDFPSALVHEADIATPTSDSTTLVDTVERITGRPARTFAQWATEHADRFWERPVPSR